MTFMKNITFKIYMVFSRWINDLQNKGNENNVFFLSAAKNVPNMLYKNVVFPFTQILFEQNFK